MKKRKTRRQRYIDTYKAIASDSPYARQFALKEERVDRAISRLLKRKNPVHIPEKVLAWRESLRKGTIMRPGTFRAIKRKAVKGGYAIPSAVGGKAYWITTLRKYLDEFPGDRSAQRTLNKLLEGRRQMRNPRRSEETLGFAPSKFRSLLRLLGKSAPAYDRGLSKYRISKGDKDSLIKIVMSTYGISKEEALNRVKQRFTAGPYSGYAAADKRNPRKRKGLWYAGVRPGYKAEVFESGVVPTRATYGSTFIFVTGPFKSREDAERYIRKMGYSLRVK